MKRVPISEVCAINPRLPAGVSSQVNREVDFLPMANLGEDGRISVNGSRRLGDVLKGYTYFENGDVIVAKITPCLENGKAAYVSGLPHGIGFGSTEFHVLRPHPCVDARFLFHMIWTPMFRHEAERNMTGTAGQQRVPSNFFGRFEIPLPPLSEQTRIADILDKADAIRRKRRESRDAIQNLWKSLFDRWFGNLFAEEHLSSRVPVSTFVERFEGGINLATPDRPAPGTRDFILKVSAVTWGDYRPEECKPLLPDYHPPHEHFVRHGDLLFSRANTTELVGATAYVHESPPNRVLPDKLWRFVWRDERQVEPLFVWALFNHPRVRYEIGRRATGTSGSMKNISMDKVLSIDVPWPSHKHRKRFAAILQQQRATIQGMLASQDEADALFASLVQRAFRGEL